MQIMQKHTKNVASKKFFFLIPLPRFFNRFEFHFAQIYIPEEALKF